MDVIKSYLRDIYDIPLLSAEEEIELAKRIAKGDTEARCKLINSNLRLVINIAKRYSHFGLPLSDLIEEGNVGLMKAVDKFSYKKGFRFSTYGAWWIKQAITRALFDQSKTIRIPVYMNELIAKWKKTRESLRQKLKRNPEPDEVAKEMKLPVEKVYEIENWITKVLSLDAPVGKEGESQVMDLIADESADSVTDMKHMMDHEDIENMLNITTKREKEVLDLRFGLSDGNVYTLAEIAKRLKVSRERVRQIEVQAIGKIRKFIEDQERLYEKRKRLK